MFNESVDEVNKIINSDHPFYQLLNEIWTLVLNIWHYQIYVTNEKQAIYISNVIVGIILLIIGFKAVKFISKRIRNKLLQRLNDVGTVNSLSQLGHYFLTILMVIFVLDISNVPLTVFAVVGTTLALGIGLGSQNIANNFISGIIIMIERPIKVGDIVEVKNITGEVIHIGARCTTIRTSKNINILIPNSNILQDSVINWTHEDTILKNSITLTVDAKVDFEKIHNLILKTIKTNSNVLEDPKPGIFLSEFYTDAYTIEIDFHIDLAKNLKPKVVLDQINRSLFEAFREHKIRILDNSNNCHCSSRK